MEVKIKRVYQAAFSESYRAELADEPASGALAELAALARDHEVLTLLYAAKDERVNHALVLQEALREVLRDAP